jgi:hypothetical protein
MDGCLESFQLFAIKNIAAQTIMSIISNVHESLSRQNTQWDYLQIRSFFLSFKIKLIIMSSVRDTCFAIESLRDQRNWSFNGWILALWENIKWDLKTILVS